MQNHKINNITIGICVLSILNLFTSCTDDNTARQPNELAVTFTATVGADKNVNVSRAMGTTWTVGDRVGIHMTTTGALGDEGFTPYVIQDDQSTLAPAYNDQVLSFPIDGSDVQFIAFSPYMDDEDSDGTTATYDLTNQMTREEHEAVDFMYYKNTSKSYNATAYAVDLNFYHKLSRVIVNVRTEDGAIADLTNMTMHVNDAPSTVVCSLETGNVTAGTQKGNINAWKVNSETTSASFQAIIAPGAATEDFVRQIVLEIDGVELYGHLLTKELIGGYSYTYSFVLEGTEVIFEGITINDWNEVVKEDDLKGALTLSEKELSLSCLKNTKTITLETNVLGITPEISSSVPDWLTLEITGSDGVYAISCNTTMNASSSTRTAEIMVRVGSREDLFKITQLPLEGIVEPANCIVLQTNGETAFIPIYTVNELATYTGVSDGRDEYVKPFADESDVRFDAKVLWVDSPNFLNADWQATDATNIIAGVGAFCSTLDESCLIVEPGAKPGNAVVCITNPDTDEIIWSWHIWVLTPEDRETMWIKGSPENKIVTKPAATAGEYAFLPLNLGAFNASGATATLSYSNGWSGHPYVGLYYQWGRKDPMPNRVQPSIMGSALGSLPNVAVGALTYLDGTDYNGLKSIRYPYNFPSSSDENTGWQGTIHLTGTDNNSWGFTSGDNGKSPFDPCPAGWRIPPGFADGTIVYINAWEGADASNWESVNGIAGVSLPNYGGHYPASGCCSYDKHNQSLYFLYGGEWGMYQCASSYSYNIGIIMFFDAMQITLPTQWRYEVCLVRCVTEKD